MSTFVKVLVAAALGVVVSALPASSNSSTVPASQSTWSAPASSSSSTVPASQSTSSAPAPASTSDTKALYQDLFTEPSAVGRFQRLLVDPNSGNLLSGSALTSAIVFDYNTGAELDPGDTAGKITAAVAGTFPVLVDQDISTVTAFLGPCSLLVPHTHPQIESLVVTEGSITTGTLIPGLVAAGHGTGEVVLSLSTYQGTVFPAGSIHYQINPTCSPAIFVSSLSSSDPGTTLESTFFSLNSTIISVALGFPDTVVDGRDVESLQQQVPQGIIISVEQCLQTCGLSKRK